VPTALPVTLFNYLTSHALARYNTHLATFRASLLSSLTRINDLIDEAHEIQERHMREKQEQASTAMAGADGSMTGLGRGRMASYWLLGDVKMSTPTSAVRSAGTKVVASRGERSGAVADSSPSGQLTPTPVWSANMHNAGARQRSNRKRPEQSPSQKRARIDSLRKCNFEVRKERYGWKGGRYYEDLRRRVNFELGA
jgi:hypothetical protein